VDDDAMKVEDADRRIHGARGVRRHGGVRLVCTDVCVSCVYICRGFTTGIRYAAGHGRRDDGRGRLAL
jgi:ribosomal protein L36